MHFDTIAAISTPAGEGAIGIVRVSGDDAVEIVNSIFKGKDLLTVPSHTIHYGNIVDPVTNESIEEVLVAVLRAPKTFTREDVVEINCHGGIMTVNKVLQTVLIKGARLAEPGEFTKRAFLNGRIDLSQAEAVMDLIRSKTDKAMKSALSQVEGRLSKLIKKLRQELIEILAHIEVNIDYPEYDDVEEMTHSMLLPKAYFVKTEIEKLLETSKQGKILREGLSTAIIGRPNVGKSSLLNALVQENKAIVTEIAGTTRDVIEEYVNVRGVPLKLLDTAGIRETEDIVEQIGVEKSRKVISEADFVLLILNNSEVLTEQDRELIKLTENKQRVILINKTDLPKKIDFTEVEGLINGDTMITGSILQDEGIEKLEQCIADLFFSGNLEGQDTTYISNTRHINILQLSHRAISDAINSIESGIPIDLAQIDLTKSWELLGEITGESVHESLLDQLFSQFCLGK